MKKITLHIAIRMATVKKKKVLVNRGTNAIALLEGM